MYKSNSMARPNRAAWIRAWAGGKAGAALAAGCLLLCACHKAPPAGAPAATSEAPTAASAKSQEAAKGEPAVEGVTLTPEQMEKMGVATQAARAIEYSEEAAGYGVVVSHDTVAQAAAELATAQATERLSRGALVRAQKLAGTPGAVSTDMEETAAQKAAVDAAALTLSTQRLSSILGMNPPWKHDDKGAILQQLAGGQVKLVRVTFPLGTVSGAPPKSLRAAHIGAGKPGAGWKMSVIWDAPADASVPGRSFFALLKGSDAGEGERLQVWTPVGVPVLGVVVLAASAVMSEGKYWCYVEKKPGNFIRTEIDTDKPTSDGYFVADGVAAGDQVVTTSAGQLLAKESGSAAEPD